MGVEAAANQVAAEQNEADRKAHEVAMAAHLTKYSMATALVAGATQQDAIVAGTLLRQHYRERKDQHATMQD